MLNGTFILSRVFITSIPKKFTIDNESLTKCLAIWVKRNILLQSTIYRTNKLDIKSPKYFVYTEKSFEEYNNVELLETENNLKWVDIIETELKTNFDNINGPLWRMKIVKLLKTTHNDDNNEYYFVFSSHHSIADGRNCYELMVQFLNILGAILEGTSCDEMNGQIQETKHSMNELVENFQSISECIVKVKEDSKIIHRIPNFVGDKENGVYGKFDFIFVEKPILDKLLKQIKLRAPKAKLTSFLATLLSLAYKKTCIQFNVNDISLDTFMPCILLSLREKFNLNNLQMGVYSTALNVEINGNLNEDTIWKISENVSLCLHDKIKNNVDISNFQYLDDFINLVNSDFDFGNNQETNFDFSNIGIMKNTSTSAIYIKQHYIAMPNLENRFVAPMFHGLVTIDSNLCWGISYNEKIFSNNFINYLKQSILLLIDNFVL